MILYLNSYARKLKSQKLYTLNYGTSIHSNSCSCCWMVKYSKWQNHFHYSSKCAYYIPFYFIFQRKKFRTFLKRQKNMYIFISKEHHQYLYERVIIKRFFYKKQIWFQDSLNSSSTTPDSYQKWPDLHFSEIFFIKCWRLSSEWFLWKRVLIRTVNKRYTQPISTCWIQTILLLFLL